MTNPIAKAFTLQGEPTQRFALLFLLGLSCFIVFARFHTYDEPVEHDITTAAAKPPKEIEGIRVTAVDAHVETIVVEKLTSGSSEIIASAIL
jgi:hypothetical protein